MAKKFKKYLFRHYNKNFPKLFRSEKSNLKSILDMKVRIEYIGITAVKGLGGKGVIDILVSVTKKELNKTRNRPIKKGCTWKSKTGSKDRLFFEKDYKYRGIIKRVPLQFTYDAGPDWKNSLLIKELLKNDKTLAEEYASIKKRAVKLAKGKEGVYRKLKFKFLEGLSK